MAHRALDGGMGMKARRQDLACLSASVAAGRGSEQPVLPDPLRLQTAEPTDYESDKEVTALQHCCCHLLNFPNLSLRQNDPTGTAPGACRNSTTRLESKRGSAVSQPTFDMFLMRLPAQRGESLTHQPEHRALRLQGAAIS